jgi:eukaryotic-like serine/threonine-protein kinase
LQKVATEQTASQKIGSYYIDRVIGQGRINTFCLAHHETSGDVVMLTIFLIPEPFSLQARQRFLTRFLDEGNLLKKLRHPHIFPVYDATIQSSIAYLVTPYSNTTPLARVLKQHGTLTLEQATPLIRQIADALDYAHQNGVVHGSVSSANVLFSDEHVVQLANFGFTRLLSMQGIVESDHPQVHLMSIAGTFLGVPEYTAPEVIHGAATDRRADVYALGILLFEMLTGQPPFTGSDPIEVLAQHFQQPIPAVSQMRSDIPATVDAVIRRAMQRDPQQRIQEAGDLARELELVLMAAQVKPSAPGDARAQALQELANDPQITSPGMLEWPTGKEPTIAAPPKIEDNTSLVAEAGGIQGASFDNEQEGVDPFTWWTSLTASQAAMPSMTGTYGNGPNTTAKGKAAKRPQAKKRRNQRRRVLAFAVGGTVAVAMLGAGGLIFAHELQKRDVAIQPTATTSAPAAAPSPTATTAPSPTPQPTKKPTAKPTKAPTKAPPPTPTPVPPPQHTGTVIGSTGQGAGTAASFTNPADGNGSFLINLGGGNFVAYEKACTHEGVAVYFSGGKLICPRHNAIFDPANGGKVLQGPANRPLPSVPVRVNADGTVTTG